MAKGRARAGAQPGSVTYFYLVTTTARGYQRSDAQRRRERAVVTKTVNQEGGSCSFYVTHGGPYDFVSIATNVSPAGALKITEAINKSGYVRAIMFWGEFSPRK
jgi:uncharacterized protein with GYD domain